MTQFWILMLHF
ncbi:hypothetical protein BpHYR1_033565 [Brachionus plicatilis]|uniref:Uncharacterized protein n=1 Tax=Brachionus plicatilis TaxID=10195 RepID=A0A3M7Q209_BRAPC|nr:hypothetical protein BpHYR1_033565 [Brachionus plicatilis]